jgi:molybdate transport system substrate-binding protein
MYKKIISIFIIISTGLIVLGCEKESKKQINVSVASSLKDPFLKIEKLYEQDNKDIDLVLNFGSSGSLKQQITQGAPCDVFVSASKKYMDELKKEEDLLDNKYDKLTENKLVLVSKTKKIKSIDDLKSNEYQKIGIGELSSVPVGQYADEVITNKGIKNDIENKFVYGKDAKEVLAWVLSENVDAGFLYSSDTTNHKLNTYNIDDSLHSPIIYPVGVLKNNKNMDESIKFKKYLLSNDAKAILENYGYKS